MTAIEDIQVKSIEQRTHVDDLIEDAKRLAEHTDEVMTSAESTIESLQEIVQLFI